MTEQKFTCWSCDGWSHKRQGPHAFKDAKCDRGRQGFPHVGSGCDGFCYEPGSDEQDADWMEVMG